MVSSRLRTVTDPYIAFFARPLAKTGLNPSFFTFMGLGFTLLAADMYASGNLIFASVALVIASVLDLADGAIARLNEKVTPFGGFLDSLTDRYSDAIILYGIAVFLGGHFLLIFTVLVGSLLVSYTRARAEMEIEKCDVGIGERAERLIILLIATVVHALNIFDVNVIYWALVILAILTHVTVIQRVFFTYRALKK
jgi:archaetidylinositol phosphate synthase